MIEKYLLFRSDFPQLDSATLEAIIIPEAVGVETKRELLRRGMDDRAVLDLIERVRKEWHRRFKCRRYQDTLRELQEFVPRFKYE